jgi:hypothetical protein
MAPPKVETKKAVKDISHDRNTSRDLTSHPSPVDDRKHRAQNVKALDMKVKNGEYPSNGLIVQCNSSYCLCWNNGA